MPPQPTDDDPDAVDTAGEQLAWAVHELAVAIAEADVAMSAALGVTSGDYLALKHLMVRPHELGPVELGRLLGISSGSATALVDRLEGAGHVVRLPHPSDRRRRVLALSEESRQRVLHELGQRASDLDEIARDYRVSERAIITTFLRALAARHRGQPRSAVERAVDQREH